MKKALCIATIAISTLIPISANAQQINYFNVCRVNREVYVPGYYDNYGRYYSGNVRVDSYNVPCNNIPSGQPYNIVPRRNYYPRYNYYNNRYGYCNPTRTVLGATLGGSIGRALTSTRNNRRNRGWATVLGASIGGLAFSC